MLSGKIAKTYNTQGNIRNEKASLERKSIIYKVLKCLQNYSVEENMAKNQIETMLLTGGGLQLAHLPTLV